LAWPAATPTATYDKATGTFDVSVDQKIWAALMAKSPLLDMIPRFSVDEIEFKWETDNEPTRTYVLASSTNGIEDAASATNTAATFTGGTDIEAGSLIRNITRATPIGTYGVDEVMEVVSNTAGVCEVVRDAARQGTVAGQGSTVHTLGDTYEVIYSPKEEGSSPGANKYKDVTLVSNYVNTVDFYLTVTGDQAASKRLVSGDTLANQTAKNMLKLQNDMEAMFLYGALNNGANAGSDSYVRRTKGLDNWVCASGGNVDYSTLDVTEDALNALFETIVTNKTDPSDRFIIACHPKNARKFSAFGADKVVTSNEASKWGRYISTFKSDLGIDAPIIWTLNCSKSDLFIIDMNKVGLAVFRPFKEAKWDYGDDGVDAWRQRYLTSVGVKVVNGLYSHGKLGKLSWT
jgi:hypothetical protein